MIVLFVLVISDPLEQPLGVDVELYRDAAARWLAHPCPVGRNPSLRRTAPEAGLSAKCQPPIRRSPRAWRALATTARPASVA